MIEKKLSEALKVMGFQTLPTAEEFQSKYRDLAKSKHPDKFPEEERKKKTEEFQELRNAFDLIKKAIHEEEAKKKKDGKKDEEKDKGEKEKEDEWQWFSQFNFDTKNSQSHTVKIQKECVCISPVHRLNTIWGFNPDQGRSL